MQTPSICANLQQIANKSNLKKKMYLSTAIWVKCLVSLTTVYCGKTATKVGLAGIATVGSGSTNTASGLDGTSSVIEGNNGNVTKIYSNEMERLKQYLFITKQYDRTIRPVLNQTTITKVSLDFTLRQILDLDEKNQVLKTYLWMRYLWMDEFLTWNASDFQGIEKIWVPAHTVWRPDTVIYEDTGTKDYNPRLPYIFIASSGKVSMAEPTVFESSCAINIAFFPFDFQTCSLTFTSWTFPSSDIDVLSRRTAKSLMNDIESYFISTGEWLVANVAVKKTSENFGSITGSNETRKLKNTLHIRKLDIDPMVAVEDIAPDRLTDVHWADIRYTFLLRRNSSLYMQSMLFPAILLTTVALLGFYLPPDSGERIGLQITILLTFMVFLLTVGEMFPASTGPFLGVYYVMCMALLGVNLFMTVLVLHMHYMPSAAVIGKNENGEYNIKPIPKWIRFLLYISKFSFRKSEHAPDSPTTKTVKNIMKTGKTSTTLPNTANEKDDLMIFLNKKYADNEFFTNENQTGDLPEETKEIKSKSENGELKDQTVCTQVTSMPPKLNKQNKIAPNPSGEDQLGDDRKEKEGSEDTTSTASYAEDGQKENKEKDTPTCNQSSDASPSLRHRISDASSSDNPETSYNKTYKKLMENLDKISHFLEKQDEQLKETNITDDIEKEWKAMARTVDKLCMKFYLFLLISSHIIILSAAIAESTIYNRQIESN